MSEAPRTILSQGTLIPVSALTVVVGGVFWLTSIFTLANSNAQAIDVLKHRAWDVNDRLIRIETKLDLLLEKLATPEQNK